MEIWIVSMVLIATLYLLISEKIPIDLTAIGTDRDPDVNKIINPH